jgi:diketogulonate reductase-like aldo/keto reductase
MGENVPFLLENETIVKIAKKHNKTPGTFLLEF